MPCSDGNSIALRPPVAQAMLQTITTMTLSFIVFTFGSLLVAIQVAGGQLTPRVIATTLLRDNVVRYTVGLFVFSLLFAISVQNRIEGTSDQLVLVVAGAARSALNSSLSLLDRLCSATVAAHQHSVPGRRKWPYRDRCCLSSTGTGSIAAAHQASDSWDPSRIVQHAGRSEVILSVNTETLLAESQKANVVVELIPVVGDFVGKDEPLFALYGNASASTKIYCFLLSTLDSNAHWSRIRPLHSGSSSISH